jgi:hypothetical protein
MQLQDQVDSSNRNGNFNGNTINNNNVAINDPVYGGGGAGTEARLGIPQRATRAAVSRARWRPALLRRPYTAQWSEQTT